MPQANIDQRDYWNGPHGLKWVAYRDVFETQLAAHAAPLLARAAAAPDARAIEVGCGFGSLAVQMARAVGPAGAVRAIDISEPMIEAARRHAAAELGDRHNITFLTGDAQTHAFEPEWADVIYSRYGVMFFADPVAAFANIRKGLRRGGRLAFLCWRRPQENPWMSGPMGIAASHVELPPPPPPGGPGIFAFAEQQRVADILERADYDAIRIDPLDSVSRVGASLDAAVHNVLAVAPWAAALTGQDAATVAAIADEIRALFAPFAGADGVDVPSASWLVSATA